MRVGIVLGRFQPLHPGHLALMDLAMTENDKLVVCIGSAQRAEPYSIDERHNLLERQLAALYPERQFEIFDLVDPVPMKIWPQVVKEVCNLSDKDENTFYRADELPIEYVKELEGLGIRVVIVPRRPFFYKAPNGLYYKASSATEIKKIHQALGVPL